MAQLSFALFNRKIELVRQAEAAECGLACLAMIAGFYGKRMGIHDLREQYAISLKGANLQQIINVALQLDLGSRPVRCELEELGGLQVPAIIHWELTHFVVLERVTHSHLVILDPANGRRKITMAEASNKYTGVAVEFSPTKNFDKEESVRKLRLIDLVPFSKSILMVAGHALLVSVFLQIFVLISPIFLQLVVDSAITQSSVSLLGLLCVLFFVVKAFESVTVALRGLMLQFLSAKLSFEMEGSVFHHLLHLPTSYFQKRFVGDIQQRFLALQSVQRLVVGTSISTVIDGVLAFAIACVLMAYNLNLSLVIFAAVLVLVAIRLVFLNFSKNLSLEMMASDAAEKTHFLETLRAIQTIKASGLEDRRESRWRNLALKNLSAEIRLLNLNALMEAFKTFLLGASNVLVVYLAAQQAMSGAFTIGMLIAFLAFKSQLETRLVSLAEAYIELRLLDAQLERVGDIVLTNKEWDGNLSKAETKLVGSIQLKSVSFRYGAAEPNVVEDVSLDIRQGEFVVFVGPSGSGKSTILKMLSGLVAPSSGEILFDGQIVGPSNWKSLRNEIGIMMQDDQLLSGTIAQNITMFDDEPDTERLLRSAKQACILSDIERMPMKFRSLVGDMGTTLSGGQAQRVMLARCLYREPAVLIMDEGTSQLDVDTEIQLNSELKGLRVTRIAAAHRPETIAAADRIFKVEGGEVKEVLPKEYARMSKSNTQ